MSKEKKVGPKQKISAEERQQRMMEAQRRELALQEQAMQAGLTGTSNMDAMTLSSTNTMGMSGGVGVGGFKFKPSKEMLRNRPLREALRPLEPSEDKIALMNEVFEDGRAPTKYETDMLSEGDHVLFITFQSGDESIGLEHFVGPIRSSAMATSQDG